MAAYNQNYGRYQWPQDRQPQVPPNQVQTQQHMQQNTLPQLQDYHQPLRAANSQNDPYKSLSPVDANLRRPSASSQPQAPQPRFQAAYPDTQANRMQWDTTTNNTTDSTAAETLSRMSTQANSHHHTGPQTNLHAGYTPNAWQALHGGANPASAAQSQRQTMNPIVTQQQSQAGADRYEQPPAARTDNRVYAGASQRTQTFPSVATHQPYQPAQSPDTTYSQPLSHAKFRPLHPQYPNVERSRPGSPYEHQTQGHGEITQQPTAPFVRPPEPGSTHGVEQQHGHSPNVTQLRGQSLTPSSIQQQARYFPNHGPSNPSDSMQPVTVDPTQVYDRWPEQQRLAQQVAEQKKKTEAAEAARREMEERDAKQRKEEADREAAFLAEQEAKRAEEQRLADATSMEQAKRLAAAATFQLPSKRVAIAPIMALLQSGPVQESSGQLMKTPQLAKPKQGVKESKPGQRRRSKKAAPPVEQNGQPSGITPFAPSQPPPHVNSTINENPTTTGILPLSTQSTPHPPTAADQNLNVINRTPQVATAADWQGDKKRRLADRVIKWLTSQAGNKDTPIGIEEIVQLLNANVAYPEFCDFLDRRGFWLNRSMLAKVIMETEPELQRAPPVPHAMLLPQSGSSQTFVSQPAPDSSTDTLQSVEAVPKPITIEAIVEPPYSPPRDSVPADDKSPEIPLGAVDKTTSGHSAANKDRKSATPQKLSTSTQSRAPKPVAPRPEPKFPLTKAEQARQRGDLALDAILLSDDEDADEGDALPRTGTFGSEAPQNPDAMLSQMDHNAIGSVPVERPRTPIAYVPSLLNSALHGKIVVEPIKRDKVARKSHYDVRTIARDVLLASGRHPDMRPLNEHLRSMQPLLAQHSTNIEHHQFDLATIRWDMLDPVPDSMAVDSTMDGDGGDESTVIPQFMTAAGSDRVIGRGGRARRGKRGKTGGPTPGIGRGPYSKRRGTDTSSAQPHSGVENGTDSQTPVAGAVSAAVLGPNGKRGRGRPRDSLSKPVEKEQTESNKSPAKPYTCEWEGCDAAHETPGNLQKHIVKYHSKRDNNGMFSCLWRPCWSKGVTNGDRHSFAGFVAWHGHIQHHALPVARKAEKRRRSGIGAEAQDTARSEADVSDGTDRTGTLSSMFPDGQIRQPDLLEPVLRTGRMPRGTSSKQERADEKQLRRLETNKFFLGPVFGQGGARLATDERRRGLYDTEVFEGEYSADEEVPNYW